MAWLALHGGAPPAPPVVIYAPKTNLLWNLSDSGVTNYYATVSNWDGGPLITVNLGITNRWVGILGNRQPTFVTVTAQSSGGNATVVSNFFVPTTYTYSVVAQTGTLGAGFADWKSLGTVSTTGQLMLRLRASVVASNAVSGIRTN